MSWNQNWGAKPKRSRRGQGGQDKPQDKSKEMAKFPAYDGKDVPASGSGSSPAGLPQEVVQLLKTLASKDPNTAAQLDGFIPNPEKEDLRLKQRQINNIRKCQQKVERKEQALAKRELQMQNFLEEIKTHIANEKARHKTDVEALRAELDEARVALQAARDGKDVPTTEADELEAMLVESDVSKENSLLKSQVQLLEKERQQHQQQMYNMQHQLDEFMKQFADKMTVKDLPNNPMPANPLLSGIATGTPPVLVEDDLAPQLGTPRRREALVPFRARVTKRASPYGKDDLGHMDS